MIHKVLFSVITAAVLCSGSVFGACVLKRRAEEVFPVTLTAIIVWLYGFYVFDLLALGYWSAIALCLLCYAASLYTLLKRKDYKASLARFFTPAMAAFSLVLVVLWLWSPRYATLWDELRLWAAAPKALYYTQRLQLGEHSLLLRIMQNYFPGMPLFQYFFSKTRRVFMENHLFFAYGLLSFSLFLPALKRLRWKHALLLPVAALLLLTVPQTFWVYAEDFCRFYTSLFIDPALALFFAYGLYNAYTSPFKEGWFATARFALGLAALVLMKDSGLLLALFCVLAAALNLWRSRSDLPEEPAAPIRKRSAIARLALSLLLPLTVFFAWKAALNHYGVAENHLSTAITAGNVSAFLFSPSGEQTAFIHTFLRALLDRQLERSPLLGPLSYLGSLGILTAFSVLTGVLLPKQRRAQYRNTLICLYCASVVFIIGLFGLSLFSFAMEMPSFGRYSCTICAAQLSLLTMFWLDMLPELAEAEPVASRRRIPVFTTILCFLFVLLPGAKRPDPPEFGLVGNFHNTSLHWDASIARQLDEADILRANDAPVRLLLVMDGTLPYADDVLLHHHLLMDMIDENVYVGSYFPVSGSVLELPDTSVRAFSERVAGYDYLYAAPGSEYLQDVADAFFGGAILPYTVYAIERTDAGVRCTPVVPAA